MKNYILYVGLFLCLVIVTAFSYPSEKLLEASQLAAILKNPNAKKPIIFNVGPSPMLPNAELIGNVAEPQNKERFKASLKNISKQSDIVIYCGCCKLEDCYNIHEADKLLHNAGYANYKILNLPTDFNSDWLNKNYPLK